MIKRLLTIALTSLLLVGCTTNKSSDNTSQESKKEVQETVSSTMETSTSTTKTTSSSSSDSIIIDKTGDWERSETLASIIDFDQLIDKDGETYQVPPAVKDYVGKYVRTAKINEAYGDGIIVDNLIIYPEGRYELISIRYMKDSKNGAIYLDDNNDMQYASDVAVEYNGATYYPGTASVPGDDFIFYAQGVVIERFGELHRLPLFSAKSTDRFFISSNGQANYSRSLEKTVEKKLEDYSLETRYRENVANSNIGGKLDIKDLTLVNDFDQAVENFLTNYDKEKESEETNRLNTVFQNSFDKSQLQDKSVEIIPIPEEFYDKVYDSIGKKVEILRGYFVKVNGDYTSGVVSESDGWTRFNYDSGDKIILK